jgi:hypothetical protein
MKKSDLFFRTCIYTSIVLFIISCNYNKKYVIEGQLSNSASTMIYLSETDFVNDKIIDSTDVNSDGYFKFKGKLDEPKFIQVLLSKSNFILLLVEPGQKVAIKADAGYLGNKYSVTGSEGSTQIKELNDQLVVTRKTIDSIITVQTHHAVTKSDDTLFMHLNKIAFHTIKKQRFFNIKFIVEHLHSLSSIVALYQQINDSSYVLNKNTDLQFINLVSDTLIKYYPDNKAVKALWVDRVRLNKIYNTLRIYNLSNQAKRISYPDIALPGVNNDTIHLKEIKSKCILINFWNPSNSDCRDANTGLMEIYRQYKSKGFEIYNVSLASDKEIWLKLVKSGEIPGINVIDIKMENSQYLLLYNIKKLPASYLIGLNGDIVEKDVYGEKLITRLKQILR